MPRNRSTRPPLEPGAKRARPLMLSTATHNGVTDVLRATMAAIESGRAEAAASLVLPARPCPIC